jgi:hypothetical protein
MGEKFTDHLSICCVWRGGRMAADDREGIDIAKQRFVMSGCDRLGTGEADQLRGD